MPPKDLPAPAAARARRALPAMMRWGVGVVLTCAILVSLAGIVAIMMPVSLFTRNLNLAPAVLAVYGSLRAGRADLAGGYQIHWKTRVNIVALPHLATSFTLEGGDTLVTGDIETGPGGIALRGADGRAGPGLAQLVPGAWNCDMTARVRDVGFVWGWRRAAANGAITTPEGTCAKGRREISLPVLALQLRRDGADAVAVLTGAQAAQLAEIRVSRTRVLAIEIQPAAAEVFPEFPRGGPISLSLPF